MTGAKRQGGWPGDARPIWPFRADKATQDAVAAYIAANRLDPKRGRSAAINALIQAGEQASVDRPRAWINSTDPSGMTEALTDEEFAEFLGYALDARGKPSVTRTGDQEPPAITP